MSMAARCCCPQDELRFWSRAKSAAEIAAGYAQPATGTETGLEGVFRLNESAGPASCNALVSGQCMRLVRTFVGQ